MAQYKRIDGNDAPSQNSAKSYYSKEEHLEVEMFQREADLAHRRLICTKNPGHEQFIPVKELSMGDLPESLKLDQVLDYIKALSKLVVRVQTKSTSDSRHKDDPFMATIGRPVYRCATGSVAGVSEVKDIQEIPCKDESCIQGIEHSQYGFIEVRTNRHVVVDTKEALTTEVEFFYDAPERMSVLCLRGYDVRKDPDNDHHVILKCVTHDVDFLSKLRRFVDAAKECATAIPRDVIDRSMTDYAIVISHPHGQSKAVSIGRLVDHKKNINNNSLVKKMVKQMKGRWNMKMKGTTYTAATCMGCAGAPVISGFGVGLDKWSHLIHHTADLVAEVNMAFH